MTPEFSVVVLCYRAGREIVPFIHAMADMLSLMAFEWELVLVANYDRGGDDPTPDVVRGLAAGIKGARVVAEPKDGMMGWDMRKGLEACTGRYVAVIDGDGQFPLESLIACLLKARREDLDLVMTYRTERSDGPARRILSFGWNALFRLLYPSIRVRDVNSKPKVFKREKLRELALTHDDWFIDAEIVIQAGLKGMRIGQIPIHFETLRGRRSFVRLGAAWEFWRNLWRTRFGS
jgi:glycosyltransferase involved in cell wall biosynthesis